MTEQTKDLLPCPFCGGVEISCNEIQGSYRFCCDNCGAMPGVEDVYANSITRWNRRASATSAPDQTLTDEQKTIMTLQNRLTELQLHVWRRPAMNMGLIEAYQKWSGECYLLDWLNASDEALNPKDGE